MSKTLSLAPPVRKLLQEGLVYHRAGHLKSAELCYRSILEVDSRSPQALHLLGLLAHQAGDYEEAVRRITASLALDPDEPDAVRNLGEAHLALGRVKPARDCFDRLVNLLPHSAEAHHRLGTTQEKLGDWEAAGESFQRGLELQPNSPDLLASLAGLQCKRGALTEAIEIYGRALALAPGRHDIYSQLGNVLSDLGRFDLAVKAHRRALGLKADSAEAVYGLGYFFERRGDLTGAEEAFRNALRLNPRLGVAHLHLGIVYILQGAAAKAIACCERLRALEPDSAEARALLGLIHLQQGNFRQGWGEYEDRWSTPSALRHRRRFAKSLWKGESLDGARILLYADQGLGDTLHFVRYVPLVAARGGRVILEVQPRLHRLLAPMAGAAEVISHGEALPEFDRQCPLMSLPWALGTEVHTIPAQVPYVFADPILARQWSGQMPANTLRIGLAWSGDPRNQVDRWRSLPLAQLASWFEIPGTTFYSLQIGPGTEQIRQLPAPGWIIDLAAGQKDFADTAAIVANLDLVISIDSSMVHLAGAMGKPIWILLSKSPDWRWLLERDDSPWYPTARLFRQSTLGNWQEVLARVEKELRALAGAAPRAALNASPSR